MNNPSPKLTALLGQLPDPDPDGKLTGPSPDKAFKLYREVLSGGRENILGLVDLLMPPGKGNDWKVRYLLHGLAVYVCRPEARGQRRMYVDALASQTGGDRPKAVQRFLVRELQVAGGKEVAGKLGELLTDEELCEPATQALIAIGQGAAGQFRQALPKVKGKNRLTVVQALGVVRDAQSVDAVRKALTDDDRQIRLAAAWALANIGDAGSIGPLLKAADADGWERTRATDACLLLAENLLAAGKKTEAKRIYSHLQQTRTEPNERYVREAAEKALAAAK